MGTGVVVEGSVEGSVEAGAGSVVGEVVGEIELEAKPVEGTGGLERQTGHCDLDGVVAAHGSRGLAQRACERDRAVEHEVVQGLRVSVAGQVQNAGRQRHLAGDVAQARLDYEEAIRRDNDGRSPSAVTGMTRVNLGLLHHEQGDQEAAERELRWVLARSSEPAVRGAAYHNLSLVLLEVGDTDGALEAAEQGHRLLRGAVGAAHGSVGASLNALGVIRAERGELDEAAAVLEAAIETRTAALGAEHPATAASYTNLGVVLGRRGEWERALEAHRRALSVDRVVLGAEHAVTAADLGHVGEALFELGRAVEAGEAFEQALAILEPMRSADDLEVERLRGWMEVCREARGE